MKKKLSLLIALSALTLSVGAAVGVGAGVKGVEKTEALSGGSTIYLDAFNWGYSDVNLYLYSWNDDGNAWTKMTRIATSGVFSAKIPDNHTKVIFTRMNPSYVDPAWSGVHNQTADIVLSTDVPEGKDTLYISGFDFSGNQWKNFANDYDIPADDGYYLLGDDAFVSEMGTTGTSWHYNSAVKMNAAHGDNNADYILTVEQTVEIRVRHFHDGSDDWRNFDASVFDNEGISKNGNNAVLVAGTYTLYVNSLNVVYIAVGMPLDAFVDGFLSDMAIICGTTGEEWENNHYGQPLINTWTLYLNRYEKGLSDSDITTFKTSQEADIVQARKLYAHCVTRYGLTAWDNGPSSSSFATYNPISVETSNYTAVIILASTLALIAVGGYFLLRKARKED